jgi:hypothetical protein
MRRHNLLFGGRSSDRRRAPSGSSRSRRETRTDWGGRRPLSVSSLIFGGVGIFGGKGDVFGVLAAVLLLVTLQTGLLQLDVNTVWQLGSSERPSSPS